MFSAGDEITSVAIVRILHVGVIDSVTLERSKLDVTCGGVAIHVKTDVASDGLVIGWK